jgi:hypothetical protein
MINRVKFVEIVCLETRLEVHSRMTIDKSTLRKPLSCYLNKTYTLLLVNDL